MEIHCIADLHGHIPDLPGGDLLIVAGDLVYSGRKGETLMFASWLDNLTTYKEKVVIGGNHDQYLAHENNPFKRAHYLLNSGIEIFGLKIWGSPYTPKFLSWHFMKQPGEQIRQIWDQIPEGIDILVTHGPPYGILDQNRDDRPCGCNELLKAVKRVRPKYHVFGHIHEEFGQVEKDGTTFINCSYVDENYIPRGTHQVLSTRRRACVPNCS